MTAAPRPVGALRPAVGPPDAPEALPLSALLSQALVAFTIEADNEAEHRIPHRTTGHGISADGAGAHEPGAPGPWLTSLLMWANCLRHLPDDGITVAGLRATARTGTNLDGMRRWGYVTFTPAPGPGRQPKPDAVIAPTAWGIAARDAWPGVTAAVESRWRDSLGDDAFGALRAALAAIVARLDPTLPDCLPILRHGLVSRLEPDQASFPPSAVSAAELPLWTLLSRPLLAFAAQYDAAQYDAAQHDAVQHDVAQHDAVQDPSLVIGPSIAIGANVLRMVTEPGVHGKDIGVLAGVSKESVGMALGVLRTAGLVLRRGAPSPGRFAAARPTPHPHAPRRLPPIVQERCGDDPPLGTPQGRRC